MLPSVLLVEDDYFARTALADLLDDQGFRVTSIATYDEGLAVAQHHVDLAIIDLELRLSSERRGPAGNTRGLEIAKALRRTNPQIPLIIWTAHPTSLPVAADLLQHLGSHGIASLVKGCEAHELLQAIDAVRDGGILLTPLLPYQFQPDHPPQQPLSLQTLATWLSEPIINILQQTIIQLRRLSPREYETAKYIWMPSKQACIKMNLKDAKAVDDYRSRLYNRLGLSELSQVYTFDCRSLVVFAMLIDQLTPASKAAKAPKE